MSAGTVTGVTVSPGSAAPGVTVTVTVTGSNPCGAAHVNWGDGTAITYAITGLPSSHAHSYAHGGIYPIVARGMGNCDGEAATKVQITGEPPAPPPPVPTAGSISSVGFSPSPATVRQPVTIAVDGHGACAFVVEYGDGNKQNFTGVLPKSVTHTYGAPGTYRVIAGPVAPCTGKFTETLEVVPRGGVSITGVQIMPSPAVARQEVAISVQGSGTCRYTLAFGDGNSEERTKLLPDTVAHVYSAPDTYTVVVTGMERCRGSVRRALTVFPTVLPVTPEADGIISRMRLVRHAALISSACGARGGRRRHPLATRHHARRRERGDRQRHHGRHLQSGLPAQAFKLMPLPPRAQAATAGVAWLKIRVASPDFTRQYQQARESTKARKRGPTT